MAQVRGGDPGGHGVGVDRSHDEVKPGERHGVGADPTAEVIDLTDTCRREAVGVAGGEGETGGLLKTVGGEEHAGREVPELVDRLRPEAGL